jgi:uncharacterized protein YbjQ (UPF0145 family)
MPFWRKDTEEEAALRAALKQREFEQQESLRQLEAGGLPLQATRRLSEQARLGHNFFSSSLSTNEYLLAREAGYQPIGQVMGTAFMQVGWRTYSYTSWQWTRELTELSRAHKQSRQLAVDRLWQEAKLLGADGVIGVRVKISNSDWSGGVTEFTAIGTAIRVVNRHLLKGMKNLPFTSSLSGQEFWQLFETGHMPCGLVMGNCSYFVFGNGLSRAASIGFWTSMSNRELTQYNDGLQAARHLAMQRLRADIAESGGDGAVDMQVKYKIERVEYEQNETHYTCMLINFMALGTAVLNPPPEASMARFKHNPLLILDLKNGKQKSLNYAVDQ